MKFSSSIQVLALGAATALAGSASVCPGNANTHATGAALQKILDYKAGSHELMAAYFRSWRDVASGSNNKVSFGDLPDCTDIAMVFSEGDEPDAFYTALKNDYVPKLHARGTKVVRTAPIRALFNSNYTNDEDGYQKLADDLIANLVTAHGLDGLDIDVEESLSDSQLQQATGVFRALSKSLGPQSGTNKLLIYDTNEDGNTDLFQAVNSYVSYVFVQSYGRSISSLQGTWDSFSPYIKSSQYLIGFSFYEERGAHWHDTDSPIEKSRAYKYAKWEPKGATKGGIFSYATDRDGVKDGDDTLQATTFPYTRKLISVMNP